VADISPCFYIENAPHQIRKRNTGQRYVLTLLIHPNHERMLIDRNMQMQEMSLATNYHLSVRLTASGNALRGMPEMSNQIAKTVCASLLTVVQASKLRRLSFGGESLVATRSGTDGDAYAALAGYDLVCDGQLQAGQICN
jgi:hypothetical protein